MILTQTIVFDAAHRLLGYEGSCKNLHGHSWKVEIEIESSRDLDQVGMLLDYRVIKQYFKDFWDHKTILNMDDPLVDILKSQGQDVTIMNGNPTAENLAKKILADMILLANLDIKMSEDYCRIVVHESLENGAEVSI